MGLADDLQNQHNVSGSLKARLLVVGTTNDTWKNQQQIGVLLSEIGESFWRKRTPRGTSLSAKHLYEALKHFDDALAMLKVGHPDESDAEFIVGRAGIFCDKARCLARLSRIELSRQSSSGHWNEARQLLDGQIKALEQLIGLDRLISQDWTDKEKAACHQLAIAHLFMSYIHTGFYGDFLKGYDERVVNTEFGYGFGMLKAENQQGSTDQEKVFRSWSLHWAVLLDKLGRPYEWRQAVAEARRSALKHHDRRETWLATLYYLLGPVRGERLVRLVRDRERDLLG